MASQERRMPQDEEQPERDPHARGGKDEGMEAVRGRDDDGRDVEAPRSTPEPERSRKPTKRKK